MVLQQSFKYLWSSSFVSLWSCSFVTLLSFSLVTLWFELKWNRRRTNLSIVKPWSQYWLIAAGAYSSFCSTKRLGVFLLPLDGMRVHRRSLPSNLLGFPNNSHLYSWVERGTVRVECLAQEYNTMSRPGHKPGPLAPGMSAMTIRPLRLPHLKKHA